MSILLRIISPYWWHFQFSRRNFVKFWFQVMAIKSFSNTICTLADLLDFGKKHKVLGFNRECIRAFIISKLYSSYNCSAFVETGTFYGHTSAYVRKTFKTSVYTSEINTTHYFVSKLNLIWFAGIISTLSNSSEFVANICNKGTLGDNPMFYLDAHFYEHMPLPDELLNIGNLCEKAIIVIDDFLIPSQPEFLYDEYPGIRIDLELVETTLSQIRKDIDVYLPNYDPRLDPTGKGIGFAVILLGHKQKIPAELFPFDLLEQVMV